MLPTSTLLVIGFTMTLFLLAAAFSGSHEARTSHASDMASTYVPLDSWAYPVFERLAAERPVKTELLSLPPWARMEYARLVEEADEQITEYFSSSGAPALLRNLRDGAATDDIALRPEWRLRLGEQTEWWHFPLLSTASQRNATFIFQLSYRSLGRTRR